MSIYIESLQSTVSFTNLVEDGFSSFAMYPVGTFLVRGHVSDTGEIFESTPLGLTSFLFLTLAPWNYEGSPHYDD